MTLIASMLSNRIRELRIEKAMTLERLSELTDLSVSYLSRLESGKRNLNTKSLVSIAAALRVKPADLIDTATAWLEVDIGAVISENQEIVPLAGDRPNTVNVPSALGLVETILVRGTTLYPRYNDGDVLTYNPDERDLSKVIGRECVVCLADKTLSKPRRDVGSLSTYVVQSSPYSRCQNSLVCAHRMGFARVVV
jgi:transcriptional regulator with XRE-family HTH domain